MKKITTMQKIDIKANPLVSVIMPVFNSERYVGAAIMSIVRQTYKNFELIIVDDASTDRSWTIITRYQKRYPDMIKATRLNKNLNSGGDSCANEAFKRATGQFVARMDADDVAHKDRIAKQVKFLQSHPKVLLVGSQASVINKNGRVMGSKTVPTTHEEIYRAYGIFHPLIHPTVMLRSALLPKRKNLYQIKYSANNDLYTFFQLLRVGQFANLDEKLLDYRVHGKNDSLTYPKDRFFNTLKIRFEAMNKFGYRPSVKAVATTTLQALVILVLPESFIIPLYLYAKGITKPRGIFKMIDTTKKILSIIKKDLVQTLSIKQLRAVKATFYSLL
jgi:glycosyltransferase involved in cell wall biosynthesis